MAVVKLAEGYDGIRGRRGIIRYRLFKDTQTIYVPRRPTRPKNPLAEKKRAARKLYQWLKTDTPLSALTGSASWKNMRIGRGSWWTMTAWNWANARFFRGFQERYLIAPPVPDVGPDLHWSPFLTIDDRLVWQVSVAVAGRSIRVTPLAYEWTGNVQNGWVLAAVPVGFRKDPPEWDNLVEGDCDVNWSASSRAYPMAVRVSTPGEYLLYAVAVVNDGYQEYPWFYVRYSPVWKGRVMVT